MKLSTVKSEGLSKEFKVTIPATEIKPVFESKLSAYAKNFSMPGFRKGKVSVQHVKARYGSRAFQEAAETLIQKTQREALEQEKIKAITAPKISVSKLEDENSDIEYTLAVDLMPDMPSVDLKDFKSEKMIVDISDKDLQALIEKDFKNFPMYKEVGDEAVAALGGAVKADVVFKVDGKSQKPTKGARIELIESEKEDKIILGLIGAKAGEERVIAFDPLEEKGQSKPVECVVKVLSVLEKTPVTFDDAFAKELGFETFVEFKEHFLKNVTASSEAKSRACLKRELLDYIDLKAVFDVPYSMVQAELESILKQIKSELTETEKMENDDEALRQEYMSIANRRVRLGLLLSEIGNSKNITVSNQELSQEIYRVAAQSGTDIKKLVDYIKQHPSALNSLQAPLFEEKVVDALLSEIKLPEKKVSLKELDKHYDEVLSSDMPEKEKKAESTAKKATTAKSAAKKEQA